MSVFPLLVIVHALAATVWTGGHLVLDLGVLPRALRAQSAEAIRSFEETFEPLGLTALAIQVVTGVWMGRCSLAMERVLSPGLRAVHEELKQGWRWLDRHGAGIQAWPAGRHERQWGPAGFGAKLQPPLCQAAMAKGRQVSRSHTMASTPWLWG